MFSGVMLGFRRVIFGSEGLYRVQWGYVVSIQHVDLPPCRAGSAVKNNKRVFIPQLDDDSEEIRRNNVKIELIKVVENYKKKNCDKFGNVLDNNLSEQEIRTIKNLKSRIKEEELVCYETDKTGKFTLDTVTNYVKKMYKHI